MFKMIMVGLILCINISAAHADGNKLKLVSEYLELSKVKESFEASIEASVEEIAKQEPNSNKEEIRAFFNAGMGWHVLEAPVINIVDSLFTIQELKDINTFYRSESGMAFATKSAVMSAEIIRITAENLSKQMGTQDPQ
ncbi:MAG: DUF2059 domain-containing protein [Pseudomonadales bacterium]|nr:DUF2059 domain-containing protein [Pseudomonadales bacterium]NRA17613.1 DUF2059 domain-containing protein [Oceanospirillaceae bacterium]